MKEYIERIAAIEAFDDSAVERNYGDVCPESVIRVIEHIPANDVVEKEAVRKAFAEACQECRDACEEFDGFYADCNQCLLHGVKEKLKGVLEVAEQWKIAYTVKKQ